jgi:hypothetical protein
MSDNDYNADHICYADEQDRKNISCKLLFSAYQLFTKAHRVHHFEDIKQNIYELDEKNYENISMAWQFSGEVLLDGIKISTCFENYIKAELLLAGFVIHKIDRNIEQFRHLESTQKRRPIRIDEFREMQDYAYDEALHEYYLPGLIPITLDYSLLLNKEAYIRVHRIPQAILQLLREYNTTRNTLHFLKGYGDKYDRTLIHETEMLITFADEQIKTKRDALAEERKRMHHDSGPLPPIPTYLET